jgi:hypothetical protein
LSQHLVTKKLNLRLKFNFHYKITKLSHHQRKVKKANRNNPGMCSPIKLNQCHIEVILSSQGNTLRFFEKEILTIPCDCMCCYNVYSEIAGLTLGEYTIEVCRQDRETHGELCRTVEIVVP